MNSAGLQGSESGGQVHMVFPSFLESWAVGAERECRHLLAHTQQKLKLLLCLPSLNLLCLPSLHLLCMPRFTCSSCQAYTCSACQACTWFMLPPLASITSS